MEIPYKIEHDEKMSEVTADETSLIVTNDPPIIPLNKMYRGNIKKQLENRRSTSKQWDYDKLPNVKDQMETSLKVLQLEIDSKLPLTQINGQRKLGPPLKWIGPAPGRKCEIFVAKLPKTIYEHEIFPIFSMAGQIYEIRLMMDFSATNRGYCFIMYTKPDEAARAVKELDQYEIAPGRRIGVVASLNKCRLYIGRLPSDIDTETVIKRIYGMTDDVEKVAVYRHSNGDAIYALVSYKTHRGAAMGRRRLVPERATLFANAGVSVEWADPDMTPSNVVCIKSKVFYKQLTLITRNMRSN